MDNPGKTRGKIHLISLGCPKNLVDSEHMLGILRERGYSVVPRLGEAEVAIVNTCGFIQPAIEEALETILDVAKEKEKGPLRRLVVTGCLVQRYGYKLRREMPEVDAWLGPGQIPRIGEIVERIKDNHGQAAPLLIDNPRFLADHTTPRVIGTPFYSAFLKIAEGCSHRCSFCVIPSLRGPY
ncbi:MAG: 30S ribosomal protein S12 methylthiotransferase RimO, partial [Deltaproteobacteria bacterium]|nr:30S ribosomal protein S12 methylthiotransferase RimO [Deltaproteobacteria bacterium]